MKKTQQSKEEAKTRFLESLYRLLKLEYLNHYAIREENEVVERTIGQAKEYLIGENKFPQIKEIIRCMKETNLKREKMVTEPNGFYVLLRESLLSETKLLIPSIYLRGNYIKYQRHLPQSPWWIGSGKKRLRIGRSSVEEEIRTHLSCIPSLVNDSNDIPSIKSDSLKQTSFYSLGREDRDTRMLYEGRPFLIKIKSICPPLPSLSIRDMTVVPSAVQIHSLRYASPSYVEWLKSPENEHMKAYRAIVFCSNAFPFEYASGSESSHYSNECLPHRSLMPSALAGFDGDNNNVDLNSYMLKENLVAYGFLNAPFAKCFNHLGKPIKVLQKTPIRVLHRRAYKERVKYVSSLTMRFLNSHYALMDVFCSAGMYVKEFVHGDHGRTYPSLCNLLQTPCDILQLDVIHIEP